MVVTRVGNFGAGELEKCVLGIGEVNGVGIGIFISIFSCLVTIR